MCVHCRWLEMTSESVLMAGHHATMIAMNSPRHTPETRAGFAFGAVVTMAAQAYFQACRTRNPEPLYRLLAEVNLWGRQELDRWPFQVQDRITGELRPGSPDDRANLFPGLSEPTPGKPSGPEVLAERLGRIMKAEGYLNTEYGVELCEKWEAGRSRIGDYPAGGPLGDTLTDREVKARRHQEETQEMADRVKADLESKYPGKAFHVEAFAFPGGPPIPGKAAGPSPEPPAVSEK